MPSCSPAVSPRNAAPPLHRAASLAICPHDDPDRPQVEDFIRSVYARSYGARINAFAPVLVALRSGREVVAAAGYRSAVEPLFLERYLDHPIERLIAPSQRLTRSRIVEVGHLAAARPGEGRRLIAPLAAHLAELDVDWVVSTVTAELRQLMVRLGLGATAIAPADPLRLAAEAASWGSYFDHEPLVMAGHLPTALRGLRRRNGLPS